MYYIEIIGLSLWIAFWAGYIWSTLSIGTKSVLFGAHCFFLHPWFMAAAWTKLYGYPFDPRLWIAFFVHDLGYVGQPNMDGPEGERHVEWGAELMGALFGEKWYEFCLYHSRHYAKMYDATPSRLCFADKLAFCYQIKPLYLWMTRLTGELDEYLKNAKYWNNYSGTIAPGRWYDDLFIWIREYVTVHKDGAADHITVDRRKTDSIY
ncbi:MAG: hypothetical protein ACREHG_03285 [Candidatus Saccharimonadales bacterium]